VSGERRAFIPRPISVIALPDGAPSSWWACPALKAQDAPTTFDTIIIDEQSPVIEDNGHAALVE
jgi:hypothetical protein